MNCREKILSEDYMSILLDYVPEEANQEDEAFCYQQVDGTLGIYYLDRSAVLPLSPVNYLYRYLPQLFCLGAFPAAGSRTFRTEPLEGSGILAQQRPPLELTGRRVVMAFIDTGISYENPVFRYSDGSSRILAIWDQTDQSGQSPEGFLYGTEYVREQIDRALELEDPHSLVPEKDEIGHGTAVASVAAGSRLEEGSLFTGAAPDCEIVAVKLRPAKQYLRDYYRIADKEPAYSTDDILLAVKYVQQFVIPLYRPIVICLGLGTNLGSHVGKSPLGLYLDDINIFAGTAVITAAGNETGYGHHYRAVTRPEETRQTVELNVGEKDSGFSMEFWAQDVDIYRVGFISPTGEVVDPLPSSTEEENVIRFLVEQTEITVYSSIINTATGSQMIFIRFKDPMPGIWNLTGSSALNVTGAFHIWLPSRGFISDTTYFLRPDPDTLVTGPGNSQYALTVSAYDHTTGGIYIHSSRGFSRSGQIKPELAAPGVNITGAGLRSGFVQRSGTSAAAAHAAGAAAILLHWGILERNDPFMNTSAIKTYLIRGAKRNPALTYPNREFGYGTLDLYQAFLRLRL